ncbi:serine hydrolase domain-containing protein [Nonomuraea sp. NPDC049714]|uniref:serine hydrolase domain-containing protein n=1 Tax=Nonomuraea sp. NPDC049714 TaxID=3364357 RepID=UPI0037B539EE
MRHRDSRPRLVAGLSLATALTVVAPTIPAAADVAPTPASLLTSLARQEIEAGAPGVIVRVDPGRGKPLRIAEQASWTRNDHHLTADSQFRMGSNVKTMVATLILQLVAERRLKLDDPVATWLPAIENGRAITVRMLLDHTSGLADYLLTPDALKTLTGQDERTWTPSQLLTLGLQQPALFAPGKEHAYSNTNYIALGMILEKVTKRSVADLIQQRIARPLGLRHTYLSADAGSRDGDRLAHGYEPDAARLAEMNLPEVAAGLSFTGPQRVGHVDVVGLDPAITWAAGAVVSTPRDWGRFLSALMSGKLLPPAQLAQMRVTVKDPSDASARYGLGLQRHTNSCGTVWGHTGGIPGYSSQNYTDSTGRRTVTVVTTTLFGLRDEKLAVADRKLIDAAICVMLGKPVPAK